VRSPTEGGVSDQDWTTYGPVARQFVGKPVVTARVANSLKIMADAVDHRQSYIWVDPPWELVRDGVRLAGSAGYPGHEDADYEERHEAWSSVVKPLLADVFLTGVELLGDGTVQFVLSNHVILAVGAMEPDQDEAAWYDDWYAKP
jgi:hypothetical protein